MAVTRWPDVVNALIDRMRATAGYRTPAADGVDLSKVLVLDGPEVEMTGDIDADRFLIVGGTIEDEQEGLSGQSFATIGARARDEEGDVICNAVAQLGGVELPDSGIAVPRDTVRSLRTAAFGILADVENELRVNPDLGFVGVPRMLAQIGDRMTPRQYLTDGGAVCSLVFAVHYTTRI